MKMTIQREAPLPGEEKNTFGKFFINGTFFCHTVEDQLRPAGVKVPKLTCIPAGVYKVVLSMSKRFKKILPEVLDVFQFLGIRLHGGRDNEDSEGCPCLGFHRKGNKLLLTLEASRKLVSLLQLSKDKEHTLEVLDPPGYVPSLSPAVPAT